MALAFSFSDLLSPSLRCSQWAVTSDLLSNKGRNFTFIASFSLACSNTLYDGAAWSQITSTVVSEGTWGYIFSCFGCLFLFVAQKTNTPIPTYMLGPLSVREAEKINRDRW